MAYEAVEENFVHLSKISVSRQESTSETATKQYAQALYAIVSSSWL